MPKLDPKRSEQLVKDLDDLLDGFTQDRLVVPLVGDKPIPAKVLTSPVSFAASVLQLICERYTEEPVRLQGEDAERTYNNPRHKICVRVARLFRSWGMTEWESTSDRVLARRVVDQIVEDLVREAFQAGAMGGVPEGDGQDQRRALSRRFEGWWLNRE